MAEDLNTELNESIAYFEQILDVLPGERTALEFLCVACQQLGDQEKFLKHALALMEILVREKDSAGAADLIEKLKDSEDPRAKEAVLKLQVLVGPKPTLEFEEPEMRPSASAPLFAAKAELALLEQLVAEGILTRTLVQTAYDQLENLPSVEGDFLISALAILEKENLPGAAEAIVAVSDAAHAPLVPVDLFDLPVAEIKRLPERLIKVRGVVPFAKLANEWCVALLNPLDEGLCDEVSAAVGAKCHFFMAPPGQMEKILEKIYSEENGEKAKPKTEAPKTAAPAPEVAPAPAPTAAVPPAPAAEPAAPRVKPKLGIRRPPVKK